MSSPLQSPSQQNLLDDEDHAQNDNPQRSPSSQDAELISNHSASTGVIPPPQNDIATGSYDPEQPLDMTRTNTATAPTATSSNPLVSNQPPPQDENITNRFRNSVGIPDMPSMPSLAMPSFSFINNLGSNVGNLPSRALGRLTLLSENTFSNLWSTVFGSQRMMPSIPNLWFLLKMKLIQQRTEEIDPLDSGAERHSVQYYSQDDISQLKIKVEIQKINELTGALDSPDQIKQKEAELKEATLKSRETLRGTQKDKAVKFVTQRLKRLQKLTKERETSGDYKKYVCVFGWQQKVFGPRELTLYRSAEPDELNSHLSQKYKLEVDHLNELVQHVDLNNPDLVPYIQDSNRIRSIRKQQRDRMLHQAQGESMRQDSTLNQTRKSDEDSQSEGEASSQSEEEGNGRSRSRNRRRKRSKRHKRNKSSAENKDDADAADQQPSLSFEDLVKSPLFSYVSMDAFHSSDILEPISCSTKSFPKKYRSLNSNEKALQSSRVQTMYIMSGIGQVDALEDGEYKWKGDEYVICIIRVYPDGTFDMKPGLSMMPQDSSLSDIQNKWKRDRLQKTLKEKKRYEKSFMFRAKDGSVYSYTIHLFNDQKRDPGVDKMRKEVLDEMYHRSLGMRQNLVGRKFTQYPLHSEQTRFHITGEIVSGINFDCSQYSVRYFIDIPSDSYNIENKSTLLLSASSQMAIPSKLDEDEEAYFSFPFNLHVLSMQRLAPPIRIYFEVKSRDYFDRYRVEGYGSLALPMRPCHETFEIPTWKPRESIRSALKSWFVGGSSELEDIKFSGIPTGFTDKYLNKYGVPTDSSGTLKVKIDVITQRRPATQKRSRSSKKR